MQLAHLRKIDWSNAEILLVNMPRHRAPKANFEILGRARYPRQGEPRNPEKTPTISTPKIDVLADRRSAAKTPPIVTIGLGCYAAAQSLETSNARAALIRNAIRAELTARWPRGMPRK
jgi:hypothetical protein